MSLFRTEAVLALTKPLTGEPLIATPPGWRSGVALTVAFLILGAATLVLIEMPRKEIASGVLVPVQGLNWVHAPLAGFVDGVHVRRGDVVTRGQPLLRISHDADVSGQSFAALNKALDGQSEALNGRIQLVQDQLRLLRREHQDQRQQLADQLGALEADVKLEAEKARLANSVYEAAQTVAKNGAISRIERDRAEAAWIESTQRLQNLKADAKSRSSQLKALPALQDRERNELDTRLAVLNQEQQSLAQRRLELRLSRVTEIAAPSAGRIVELKPDAGSFITAHSPQIAILPEGDTLQAELQVPSSALGLVTKGTPLRLHLESFPHAKFGAITGTVTEVSPVLQPPAPAQSPGLPTFRVLARLHTTEVQRGSQSFTLQPDMRLQAFVLLERRKAWEWLFEPLLDALRR